MRRAAYRLTLWQLAITALVAAVAGSLFGVNAAKSAAAGGGIGMIAGLYQALRMFHVDASESPERFMRAAVLGELVKVGLTVALFIAAIRILNVQFGATMVAYAAIYIAYWIALNSGYPWMNGPEKTS